MTEGKDSFFWTGMHANEVHFEEQLDPGLLQEEEPVIAHPSMYEVLILNDEFTPMDFVVFVIKKLFHRSHDDAIRLMLQVHHHGEGICGIYTREIAETKMMQVINLARENLHPLKCVMRKTS